MTKSKSIFSQLALALIFFMATAVAQAKPTAVIIDIDDTLMDTRGRTREILLEIGTFYKIPELQTLTLENTDSSCHKTCSNAGIKNEDTLSKICGNRNGDTESQSLWGKKFFLDGTYLKYDHVVPGAVAFLKRISELPVHIIYLSGRKEKYMLKATRKQLNFHHFPTARMGSKFTSEIILKPESANNNIDFKKNEITKLKKKYNIVFAVDDNEKNVNMFRNMLDESAIVVLLNKDLSKSVDFSQNVVTISNFYFNEKTEENLKTRKSNQEEIEKILNHIQELITESSGSLSASLPL